VKLEDDRHLSRVLRRLLTVAKVERAELYASDLTRKPITWHDLRATGLTWLAVRGEEPLRIKQRAGHTAFAMTEKYIREGEAVRDGFGDVFPPLPEDLLGGVSLAESLSGPPDAHDTASNKPDATVEAPGIEGGTMPGIKVFPGENTPSSGSETGPNAGNRSEQSESKHAAESALAVALERASMAGEWALVAQLARELEARRLGF
jgi:hypothetical protein